MRAKVITEKGERIEGSVSLRFEENCDENIVEGNQACYSENESKQGQFDDTGALNTLQECNTWNDSI